MIHSPVMEISQPEPALPIRLIAGLGNPGPEYEMTRHNLGFMVLDALAQKLGLAFSRERAWRAQAAIGSGLEGSAGKICLLKPETFMNLSGQSLVPAARYFKLTSPQALVVVDDVALPLGTMKLRPFGSAGGHNGLRSIIESFGSQQFPRLRVGIAEPETGSRPDGSRLSDHVLGRFSEDERALLPSVIDRAVEAILRVMQEGIEPVMNWINRKPTNT